MKSLGAGGIDEIFAAEKFDVALEILVPDSEKIGTLAEESEQQLDDKLLMAEICAPVLDTLDTENERDQFTASLVGKRILHVKGFGSSFKEPSPAQEKLEFEQRLEGARAIMNFRPDYLVVDGDPWGNGFQQSIKTLCALMGDKGGELPQLIWAKNMELDSDGRPSNAEERSKRLEQAERWSKELAVSVKVYWIDAAQIRTKMNDLFGRDTVSKLEGKKFNARGAVSILSGEGSPPAWVSGMDPAMREIIEAMETRNDQPFFEKCSFENAAKGNVIFDALDVPGSAAHGALTLGGGESVVLEFATKYLNSESGFRKGSTFAAVYTHSRGKEESDPKLPKRVGAAFMMQADGHSASESAALIQADCLSDPVPAPAALIQADGNSDPVSASVALIQATNDAVEEE